MSPRLRALLTMLCLLPCAATAQPASPQQPWVTSWYASPQPRWDGDFPLPTKLPYHLWNQTVRQTLPVSVGGARIRVVLSNAYGSAPLLIGAAHVARAAQGPAIAAGTDHVLTFSGQPTVSIPPGAALVSDAIALPLGNGERVAISLYLPQPTPPATFHWEGLQDAWFADGNVTDAASITPTDTAQVRLFVTAIQVETAAPRLLVTLGDSITDGNGSTPGTEHRWPDYLAGELAGRGIAVANAGISGARMLSSLMGENALARFDRDVLMQPGVESVVLMMGINDIGWPATPLAPDAHPVDVQALIGGYRQLIARAHSRGVRIVGATLTPFEGALSDAPITGYYTPDKERARQAINQWIRDSGEFDTVADFDVLLRDPTRPSRMRSEYDSGDHLHPGDAGYAAMGHSVAATLAGLDRH
jgi:lysophospholipase L1-like esterase